MHLLQISRDQRDRLTAGAATCGYTYLAGLDKERTTHLICIEAEGEKWEAARRWGLYCVTYTWVVRSMEAGYALPEHLFQVGDPLSSQTATDSQAESVMSESQRLPRKRSSRERRSESPTNFTQDKVRRSASPDVCFDECSMSRVVTPATQTLRPVASHLASRRLSPETVASATHDSPPTEKESFFQKYAHLLGKAYSEVFDGMEIALVACDADQTAFFRKLVRERSGFVKSLDSGDVHYVVVGKATLDDEIRGVMRDFADSNSSAVFVTYEWLIQSAQQNEQMSPELFKVGGQRATPEAGDGASAHVSEQPNLGFKVTRKDYSNRNVYKRLSSLNLSGSSFNECIGDEALVQEYSRRSDSTQCKGRGTQSSSACSEDEEQLTADNSQWKKAGLGRRRESSAQEAEEVKENWDDACSIVSDTTHASLLQPRSSVPVVGVGSQAMIPGYKRPQTACVTGAQRIHDAINEHNLEEARAVRLRQPPPPQQRRSHKGLTASRTISYFRQ